MHPRGMRASIFIAIAVIAMPVSARECVASGVFVRSPGEELLVESANSMGMPPTAKFDLLILGSMIQDAPTVGRAEGIMDLSNNSCLGVYRESELCTLVFEFQPKSVKLRQIGNCGFGTGADADGIFQKKAKRARNEK